MKESYPFSLDIIRSYFRSFDVEDQEIRIKADISGDHEGLIFQIAIISARRESRGSFPRSRVSLERHGVGVGHSGVHLQMKFHKIENPLDIGSMHILLDIEDNDQLMDVSEGFIYCVYEMIGKLDNGRSGIRDRMFISDIVEPLEGKKEIYMKKLRWSLSTRPIEIIDSNGRRSMISNKELGDFMIRREEIASILPGPPH